MPPINDLLAKLSESGERGDPLVFAGREDIIGKVIRASKSAPPNGAAGNSFVIEGAPGAGKTALVNEIARRLRGEGATAIVCTDVEESPRLAEDVYLDLAVALAEAKRQSYQTTQTKEREGTLGVPIAGKASPFSSQSIAPPSIAGSQDIARLRDGKPWQPSECAVVFIDEIQKVKPDTATSAMLGDMHTQQRIPVLLVCSGLSNSEIKLGEAGLSRFNPGNIVPLGRFSPDETLDCARRTFDLVREEGLKGSDAARDRWAERVAQRSDDWPRHLRSYLNACWAVLSAQDIPSLDSADLEAAISLGDDLRNAYYRGRVAASGTDVLVLGALHGHLGGAERISRAKAYRILGEAAARLDSENRKAHEARFPHSRACFERMLQSGVISLDEQGRCISPVPSLSDHILAECEEEMDDLSRNTNESAPQQPT